MRRLLCVVFVALMLGGAAPPSVADDLPACAGAMPPGGSHLRASECSFVADGSRLEVRGDAAGAGVGMGYSLPPSVWLEPVGVTVMLLEPGDDAESPRLLGRCAATPSSAVASCTASVDESVPSGTPLVCRIETWGKIGTATFSCGPET